MTLVVSLKSKGGTVLASDTRVMYGLTRKKDRVRKVKNVNREIAMAAAGLVGAIDDIEKELELRHNDDAVSFDEVVETLSNLVSVWWNANKAKFADDETQTRGPDFVLVSRDRIRLVFGNGYSEEIDDYTCIGSGVNYGEYILQGAYNQEMSLDKATQLAIYTIIETSKVDPTVGSEVSVFVYKQGMGMEEIKKDKVDSIISQLPGNIFARREEEELISNIIHLREQVNNLFKTKFKFELFNYHELSVLKLYKPCRNEEEYSLHIAALGLLVDRMNGEELKKVLGSNNDKSKTLGLLNEFLQSRGIANYEPTTDGFNKIRTLRSGHFPIHPTETDFISLVMTLMNNTYPPDWAELWIKSLELYLDSLTKIHDWLKSVRANDK